MGKIKTLTVNWKHFPHAVNEKLKKRAKTEKVPVYVMAARIIAEGLGK
jgi:hypothetical protein